MAVLSGSKAVPPKALLAAYEAAKATPGIKRYRLGACLFNSKGHIVNAKGNSRKTHPFLARYTSFPFYHAESYCILSNGLDRCRNLSLLVLRVNCEGDLTMARPCEVCSLLIKEVGIRQVFYTNWNGDIDEQVL